MQNFQVKEVKKCFSKTTEKAVKKRGISLSKHWICAYKSHLLGAALKPTKSRTPKGMRRYIKLQKYVLNSILSKKIEYSQVKSLMNTQYGRSDRT